MCGMCLVCVGLCVHVCVYVEIMAVLELSVSCHCCCLLSGKYSWFKGGVQWGLEPWLGFYVWLLVGWVWFVGIGAMARLLLVLVGTYGGGVFSVCNYMMLMCIFCYLVHS